MNHSRRHSYYVKRTMTWLEDMGYVTEKVEVNYSTRIGGRDIYVKRDMWGADIAVRNKEHIAFIQVKTSDKQISTGIRQLSQDDQWPKEVGRYVIYWPLRAKTPDVRLITGSLSYFGLLSQ